MEHKTGASDGEERDEAKRVVMRIHRGSFHATSGDGKKKRRIVAAFGHKSRGRQRMTVRVVNL